MNKKIIFAIAALLSISMLFTACGKKDADLDEAEIVEEMEEDVDFEEKSEEIDEEILEEDIADEDIEDIEEGDVASDADMTEEIIDTAKSKSDENKEVTAGGAPITNDKGEVVTSEDFVDLVDTFNNTDDEAAKEEARKQLEAILKQAEANAK